MLFLLNTANLRQIHRKIHITLNLKKEPTYIGTPILRYGKGQQNHIVKSGNRCKQTPD